MEKHLEPCIDSKMGHPSLTISRVDELWQEAFQECAAVLVDDRVGLDMLNARRMREEGRQTGETR